MYIIISVNNDLLSIKTEKTLDELNSMIEIAMTENKPLVLDEKNNHYVIPQAHINYIKIVTKKEDNKIGFAK